MCNEDFVLFYNGICRKTEAGTVDLYFSCLAQLIRKLLVILSLYLNSKRKCSIHRYLAFCLFSVLVAKTSVTSSKKNTEKFVHITNMTAPINFETILTEALQNFGNEFTKVLQVFENAQEKLNKRDLQIRQREDVLALKQQDLERREKNVDKTLARIEEENNRVLDFNLHSASKITLNVGGKVMETSKATLTAVPGSMLSAMFSGKHVLAKGDQTLNNSNLFRFSRTLLS